MLGSTVTREITMAIDLVTGGGGFIGSHLVHELVAAGEEIRVLDNSWLTTGVR